MSADASTILIVEPSAPDRLLAARALHLLDPAPQVQVFASGDAALAAMRDPERARPSALLLTIDEGRLANLDVLRAIRRDPYLHELPVVTLATPEADLVELSMAAGATSHFHKPSDRDAYGQTLRCISRYWTTRATSSAPVEPPRGVSTDGEIRVLLVEDSVPDFYLFRRALRRALPGHTALTHTRSVSDALASLDRRRFDVVVTDLTLPDAAGVAAVETLHAKAGEAPIVVLTGDHDPDTGPAAMRAGADDYLVKSELTPSAIARSLTYALERRAVRGRLLAAANMRRVGLLAGTVAHDVNNVLTVVRSCADALRDDPSDLPDILEDLIEATERGRALSRRLLAMGRQEPLERTDSDLGRFVRERQSVFERLGGSGVEVSVDLADRPLPCALDPVSLEQAVLSLIDNAIAAMNGAGTLRLATRQEGDRAILEVADDGAGIPEHVLPRVFEPFYTTRPFSEGSGIGLPSARETLRQHGGDLVLASTPGEGTTATLYLPLSHPETADDSPDRPTSWRRAAPRRPSPARSQATTGANREPGDGARRVLVVDDEETLLKSVVRILRRGHHTCLTARTVEEAASAYLEQGPIDLVLTDIVLLKGEYGFDVADALRDAGYDGPVLYMSAWNLDQNNPRARLVPGQNYLAKPFDAQGLLKFVDRAMETADDRAPGGPGL